MHVSVEHTSKLERKLTVSVPASQIETQISERMRDLSRNVRLKGFRPGKVPAKIIEQRFGAQVRNEAFSEVIRESFGEALRQNNLRPAVPPSIETTGQTSGGEFSYVATFEVMPEVGTIDVSGLTVKRPQASVEDADVDHMIETLRLQRRQWKVVERAAQAGDLVMFESTVMIGDKRVPAEGVDRSGTVIGSNAIYPEVEAKLVGLAAEGTAELTLTFPSPHAVPELAGQTGTMSIKVVRVSEGVLPAVDEAFIASFGIAGGDLEAFRREVRANLERELKGALMGRLKADVVSKLLEAHASLEIPQKMIEAEARAMANQAEQQARQQGRKDIKIAIDGYLPVARQRVAAAILLGELARQNSLQLDRNRLNEMLASIASTYEEPMQVIEMYRNDPQLMQGLESRVIEDQVIDWIADHAELTVQQLTFAEVMRPGAAG